jgi:long-chain acyl-CoA synthetase
MTGAVSVDTHLATALLVLDPGALAASGDPADHPAVREAVAGGVAAADAALSRPGQIKRYDVLADVWRPGGNS